MPLEGRMFETNMAAPRVGFKDSFKYYKSRVPPPDLTSVIDLEKHNFLRVKPVPASREEPVDYESMGLSPPQSWKIFEFLDIPDLIFIQNPFTRNGQRYWITKCLRDYSRKPNKLNIDAHDYLQDSENWWDVCATETERGKELIGKLRWATLGYHHNWDTKKYSEESRDEMPAELVEMTGAVAKILGDRNFKAEAAIINYYHMNSTLAGHTDHSEVDRTAPLFSISFGQSAIFLIGGSSQEESANALLLRSGDIVVMSGQSRLRYHGVPKILPAESSPWASASDEIEQFTHCEDWRRAETFVSHARINMNVRQVLKHGQMRL